MKSQRGSKLSRRRREPEDPELRERIATLETDMKWVVKKLEAIDARVWWILGSVVVLGVIAILIAVLK